MLAFQSSTSSPAKCIPNVIPCRIHHTGPTKITKRYWAPFNDKDGAPTSYFRGRKLRGRTVKLPTNYQGLVLKPTEKDLPQYSPTRHIFGVDEDDEDDFEHENSEELTETTKLLEKMATFDELIVWGHDQIPAAEDAFVKNIEEWIQFAEAIHCNDDTAQADNAETQNSRAAAAT